MGLLKEFQDFHEDLKKFPEKNNAEGVMQSIGYKEFLPFLNSTYNEKENIEKVELQNEKNEIIDNCRKKMTNITRKYAKKQLAWFSNKWKSYKSLLFFCFEKNDEKKFEGSILFDLDTTNKTKFLNETVKVAGGIAQKFMNFENDNSKNWTDTLSEDEKMFQVKEPSEFSKNIQCLEWKK